MRHGSLFSGIGGFDLAAEWMGWENVFHCEWNTFGQKVLKYYWPNSIQYHDITKTDFTIHRGDIDIISGGFPCQPFSQAGERLGTEDERSLWPEMLRAIREIQPTWIVAENVFGITNWNEGMVFDQVQSDLESNGYEVTPFLLPACSVNAPHKRERVFFIAYKNNECKYGFYTCSNNNIGFCESCEDGSNYEIWDITNSDSKMLEYWDREGETIKRTEQKKRIESFDSTNKWETFPSVSPICNGDDGLSGRLDSITFSKWRAESIRAGGNAVVPQVVHMIFKAIQEYENQKQNL